MGRGDSGGARRELCRCVGAWMMDGWCGVGWCGMCVYVGVEEKEAELQSMRGPAVWLPGRTAFFGRRCQAWASKSEKHGGTEQLISPECKGRIELQLSPTFQFLIKIPQSIAWDISKWSPI